MFVRMNCKECNQKRKDELYQVFGALAQREKMQIEEVGDEVQIYACPEGIIHILEEDDQIIIEANTRHAGCGFHAFVVEFCCDVQEEIEGEYDLQDDLDYASNHDFQRLFQIYEDEITYLKDLLIKNPEIRTQNYLYESTYILPLEKDQRIPTAIGDLDLKDFANRSEMELMDSFYVWNDWEKNARFYKNAALLLLAKEGVGPFTTMDEKTIKYADEICDYIELAYQWNPDTSLPVKAYQDLCAILGRENQLKSPIEMEEETIQYRNSEVYHLWEDFKLVAHGASQRSIDPVNEALCLTSPYQKIDQWDWFIMASKKDAILERKEELLKEEMKSYQNKKIAMITYKDTVDTIEAILQDKDKFLYFHCVVFDPKDLSYIQQCIKESGFLD